MSRSHWARGTFLLTLLAVMAGCQDYNFNPVGHCLIQPGSERVTLSSVSSADVLFVVDDSGSMGAEQAALAANFASFIANLDQANAARRSTGLEPFDFHIAVTSTSMFYNQYTSGQRPNSPWTCSSTCGSAAGQPVCCMTTNTPARTAKSCAAAGTVCPTGTECRTDCRSPYATGADLFGEKFCCDATGGYPAAGYVGDTMPCSREGTECGTFERHYNFVGSGCGALTNVNGVATNGFPYPQGDFVSGTNGGVPNPRVLHFDRSLYPPVSPDATLNAPCAVAGDCGAGEVCVAAISASNAQKFCRSSCGTCPAGFSCVSAACQPTNAQSFTSQELVNFFSGPGSAVTGNVEVGVCGSGQEQALAAARAAIEKARDGRQTDSYPRSSGTPGSSPAEWLVPGASSKLVVVIVGDEDDCSPTAADPSGAVVWNADPDPAVGDSCRRDALLPAPHVPKLLAPASFATFLTGLGREVAAAFILPVAQNSCSIDTCTADDLCCPPGQICTAGENNGAQSRGIRLLEAAHQLRSGGVEVMAGSICDGSFASILDGVAELVKPPAGLQLPSAPAAGEVTVLRIVRSSGQTRKTCNGPAPAGLAPEAAAAARDASGNLYDWWFTATKEPGGSSAVSTNIYINPNGACKANPGETYSADYLGRIPSGGCQSHAQCQTVLGGAPESWTCFAGMSGDVCTVPTAGNPGTCICGRPADNCPNG